MSVSPVNWISVLLVALFLLPMLSGAFRSLTASRIFGSFSTLFSAAEFILAAGLALLVTEAAFDTAKASVVASLVNHIPALQEAVAGQDILAYVLLLLLLLLVFSGLLHLVMLPVVKLVLLPASSGIARKLSDGGRFLSRLFSAVWELPKAFGLVLLLSFIFNLYVSLSNNAALCGYISDSRAYQAVEAVAIKPLINSKAIQAVPPLIDNTINRVVNCLSPEGRRLLIRVYINGMKVEDAVISNPEIDNVAIDLVDTETDDYKKAELLYGWICDQITYDREKADQIAVDAFAVTSGSVPAFTEKTGICFDKACLFVSMCRAVDIPVRLMTGQGYNGMYWEDHSWNQIYDSETCRWVNVDTTFGNSGGNYFDRHGFYNDHRYEDIQGEWLD